MSGNKIDMALGNVERVALDTNGISALFKQFPKNFSKKVGNMSVGNDWKNHYREAKAISSW